jgi:ribosomal protein L11 methyltransferase
MDWLEITITTAPAGIEDVAAALTAEGFDDLLIEDQAELEGFLEQNRAYWDYIDGALQKKLQGLSQIKLYLEETDSQGLSRLRALVQRLKGKDPEGVLGPLEMKVDRLAQTDWEESWKENYPPQQVGKNLVVLPYWLPESAAEGRKPVILDPGLTFGTGAHPSTQMVMEVMEERLLPGSSCLDLGSGSGILSITALRLGAASAVGVDIDPKAEDIARENAGYNGFAAPEFTALTGNVLADKNLMAQLSAKRYDMVLVNIVADVIVSLAPVLPALLDRDSVLILSGILDTRLSDVAAALERAGLRVMEIRAKEEWRCVCAKGMER